MHHFGLSPGCSYVWLFGDGMNKDFGEAPYWRAFLLSILLSNGNSTVTSAQQTPASKALPLPWSFSLYYYCRAQIHVLRYGHVPE